MQSSDELIVASWLMGFYERRIFPVLIDRALRNEEASVRRACLVPRAHGVVLEVGIGSGLNLPFYGPDVSGIVGLDPSPTLLTKTRERASRHGLSVLLCQGSAETIPLASRTIDTLVMTWTLCSIPDPLKALREMRRVLRVDGHLLFIEHGLAADRPVARWQRRLDPLWRRISCHLDRSVDRLLEEAGFVIEEMETGYAGQGPRVASYLYQGWARPGEDRSLWPAAS